MSAPPVQLLWESGDPDVVLRTRFGFDDAGSAARWVSATLADDYGVVVDRCERIVLSSHNALAWLTTPDGPMLARWSVAAGTFPRLAALAALTARLGAGGLPVSMPVPARDGRLQVEIDGASMGLQRKVTGELLDIEDAAQVRAAGVTLALLHEELSSYGPMAGVVAPRQSLREQVTGWLEVAPRHLPAGALDRLRSLVAAARPDLPPKQLVHGDYRSANILYAAGRVTAVLDFEEARLDHCIGELARSAVLLGTRFHDWGPVSPAVRQALRDGYESHRRLTTAEASWWEPLVLWHALLFVPDGDDPTGWGDAALRQLSPSTSATDTSIGKSS
ncbi:phosphotransferase enzyme family protein [Flexivirga aerilata]|uniref:phosphotransferase enzyme family protein n=1 Tax=Flexivirga aerilata TaxID=1656889 RepID=UPI001BB278C7